MQNEHLRESFARSNFGFKIYWIPTVSAAESFPLHTAFVIFILIFPNPHVNHTFSTVCLKFYDGKPRHLNCELWPAWMRSPHVAGGWLIGIRQDAYTHGFLFYIPELRSASYFFTASRFQETASKDRVRPLRETNSAQRLHFTYNEVSVFLLQLLKSALPVVHSITHLISTVRRFSKFKARSRNITHREKPSARFYSTLAYSSGVDGISTQYAQC